MRLLQTEFLVEREYHNSFKKGITVTAPARTANVMIPDEPNSEISILHTDL